MADIFVSYASEDRDRVRPLVEALEAEGWSVWWDRELYAGPRFDAVIEEAIDAARCIVVVWSEHSVRSDWVRTEANEGLDREILAPALIDDVRPPLAFRRTQTAQIVGWPGQRGELQTLFTGIRELIGAAPGATGAAAPDPGRSVAVLPFLNMSADAEQEFFVDGMTEDLIDRLAKIRALKVIARTSSFQFKGKTDDVREIGAKLGVTHLVEGSVRRAGNRVRITAQLVRADDGTHEWSEQYDRDLDDVFALQDEITAEVAKQLHAVLLPQAAPAHRPSTAAYDEALLGRSLMRRLTFDASREARRHFTRAVELDPDYADAHAEIASALLTEHVIGGGRREGVLERSRAEANEALRIDSDLPLARLVGARLDLTKDLRLQDALNGLKRLYDEGPVVPELLYYYLGALAYLGRLALIKPYAEQFAAMDPYSVQGHFWSLVFRSLSGDLEGSEREIDAILAIEPAHEIAWLQRAQTKVLRGQTDEGIAILEARGMKHHAIAVSTHALRGSRADLEAIVENLRPQRGGRAWLAHAYACLGERDAAVATIDEAIRARDPQIYHFTSPMLGQQIPTLDGGTLADVYAGEPVQALLRPVGLDWETVAKIEI